MTKKNIIAGVCMVAVVAVAGGYFLLGGKKKDIGSVARGVGGP